MKDPATQAILQQLADVHTPATVPAFPWAPGWWALLCIALAATGVAAFMLLRRHRRRRYRRQALDELRRLAGRHREPDDDRAALQQLNQLLRRVARQSYPREGVSGLSGEQWAAFLRNRPGAERCLAPDEARLLADGAYRPDARIDDPDSLFNHCAQWLRRHRESRYA